MKYIYRNHSYQMELAEDETYPVSIKRMVNTPFIFLTKNTLRIHNGYAWDGSSIPGKKFLWAITFKRYDGDRYCKEASLVHDAFYQLMRLKHLSLIHKVPIDRLYELMCIDGGRKVIIANAKLDRARIKASNWSGKKKVRKLKSLDKKRDRKLKRLPAWAARRYWFVKKFGARTLKPRFYPEKQILET